MNELITIAILGTCAIIIIYIMIRVSQLSTDEELREYERNLEKLESLKNKIQSGNTKCVDLKDYLTEDELKELNNRIKEMLESKRKDNGNDE